MQLNENTADSLREDNSPPVWVRTSSLINQVEVTLAENTGFKLPNGSRLSDALAEGLHHNHIAEFGSGAHAFLQQFEEARPMGFSDIKIVDGRSFVVYFDPLAADMMGIGDLVVRALRLVAAAWFNSSAEDLSIHILASRDIYIMTAIGLTGLIALSAILSVLGGSKLVPIIWLGALAAAFAYSLNLLRQRFQTIE